MVDAKSNLIAQWAFDTRPVLGRFHLWLEDVEVEWEKGVKYPGYTFAPRGIRRCLAVAGAVTSLGTKLYGSFGGAVGADKAERNRVKKNADAVAAYTLSEALWYTTRSLPENHALMVCLGEGQMPKAGETPLMGANPLLGFGRVYARPEVAEFVDRQVRRLLNEPGRTWEEFYNAVKSRGITLWGAAIDTLENTTRFADGEETGPMSVLHVFDQPLVMIRPYESYISALTVPKDVSRAAEENSILLDVTTPRADVLRAVQLAYPGVLPCNVHVWTLGGERRRARLGELWDEWDALGVHRVEHGWVAPTTGVPVFTDSGTYAPTYLVGSWQDDDGAHHVFLADGYSASAEALQAASLSEALEVDVTLALCSPRFAMSQRDEWRAMRLPPDDPHFAARLSELMGREATPDEVEAYRDGHREAQDSNVPLKRVLRADDFFPEKRWRVLATSGYMGTDPYTGTEAVTRLADDLYRVTSRLATRHCSIRLTFVFRLMEGLEKSRLVFSPLLTRFMTGTDWRTRAVKVSDSGRIRNELQTMMSSAIEHGQGGQMRVYPDRMDDSVLSLEKKALVREVLEWYQHEHPMWFDWLFVH